MILPRRASDLALVAVIAAVVIAAGLAASAKRPVTLDERARSLAAELRCPVCQGLSIADSPAPLAGQMRSLVREQLAAGASDADVRNYFVARYGTWILLAPPPEGMNALIWLAPGAFVLTGLVAVAWRSGRQAQPRSRGRGTRLGRLATVLVGVATGAAVAVPLALAAGSRVADQEITGFFPGGLFTPSLAELEARVAQGRADVVQLVALADAYVAQGRLGDAAPLYRRALEQDVASVPALVGVGVILVLADRPDAAIIALDRALASAPDDPDALIYRALARARLLGPDAPGVRQDAARFLEVAPDDPRAPMARRLIAGPGQGTGEE